LYKRDVLSYDRKMLNSDHRIVPRHRHGFKLEAADRPQSVQELEGFRVTSRLIKKRRKEKTFDDNAGAS
jgi:hypothetical protein